MQTPKRRPLFNSRKEPQTEDVKPFLSLQLSPPASGFDWLFKVVLREEKLKSYMDSTTFPVLLQAARAFKCRCKAAPS